MTRSQSTTDISSLPPQHLFIPLYFRCPQSETVPEQLHDQEAVFVQVSIGVVNSATASSNVIFARLQAFSGKLRIS